MLRFLKISQNSRYFLTISYIFMLVYKVCLAGQYLASVPDHSPLLLYFPLSLVLAAADFIFLFVFFRICDLFNKFKILNYFYIFLFLSAIVFFFYDVALFQYFRKFNNYGLSKFLAYDPREISRYVIYSMNPFFAVIVSSYFISLVLMLVSAVKRRAFIFKPFSDRAAAILLAVNIAAFSVLSFLPFEETVGLETEPVFEYFSTRILKSYYLPVHKKAETVEYPGFSGKNSFPAVGFDMNQTKGKNVILIILESTAFEKTPLGGDARSNYSFLTELAEKSLNFVSHRTVFPATTRSVLSLFCSGSAGTDYESITKLDAGFDCESIFDVFAENGYSTSFFSPVLLDFDNFESLEMLKRIDHVFEPSQVLESGNFNRKFGTATAIEEEIVQEDIFRQIQEARSHDKPFFAVYFPYWTHAPYEVPFEDTSSLNSLERYYRSQKYINDRIGELLNRLDKENVLENSIVIITADHGEAFGRKVGNYIHPNYLWDENIHIPFLIYAKGVTDKTPQKITNPTTVLDVAPTIAKLAGIEPASSWTGLDMFGGKSQPVFIYTRAMNLFSGILDGNRKFFFNHVTGENYYFDLKNDPQESNNLAGTLDDNTLKQLKKFTNYKNCELNGQALKSGKKPHNQ